MTGNLRRGPENRCDHGALSHRHSLFGNPEDKKGSSMSVEEGAFSRTHTRHMGLCRNRPQTFLDHPKYPIRIAKCEIHPAIMAITGKGNTTNRTQTCDMLVNSPNYELEHHLLPVIKSNQPKEQGKKQEGKKAESSSKGFSLTAIKPDEKTLRKMAEKHNVPYELMKDPKVYAKHLGDDLSRYILYGTKENARPTTTKPLSNNVQSLIKLADDAKVTYGKPKNQVSKVSGTVTYTTIRQFNAHCNTLASDTPLTDVQRFLTYLGKEREEPMLITWAESLKYEKQTKGATFATEGGKTDIHKDGPAQDIKAYCTDIINPATKVAARRQAYRNLVAILFGTTTGIRVKEFHRLTWQKINRYKADETVRLPNNTNAVIPKGMFLLSGEDAKTGDARAIPIHPAIQPYLELLEEVYPDTHYQENQFIKTRSEMNKKQPDAQARYTFAQVRNFAAKYWRDFGIRAFYRLSIMGHDTDELKKDIEKGYIDAGELAETAGISSAYVGYSPAEILKEYMNTVGAKFNPIPEGIDIKEIRKALNLK